MSSAKEKSVANAAERACRTLKLTLVVGSNAPPFADHQPSRSGSSRPKTGSLDVGVGSSEITDSFAVQRLSRDAQFAVLSLDCEIGREVEPLAKVVVLRGVVREPIEDEQPVSGIQDEEPCVADGLKLARVGLHKEEAVFGLAPALDGRAVWRRFLFC